MPSPPQVLRELVEAAILWRKTKVVYLAKANDKNLTEADVSAARKVHMQAVGKLESAVLAFERLGRTTKGKRPKKPIDWKKLIDGVSMVSGTLSRITDPGRVTDVEPERKIVEARAVDMSNVIDMPVDK